MAEKQVVSMLEKNGSVGALEALQGHFGNVFDIDIVLGYDFEDFFEFCQYLCCDGYKADGFAGRLQSPEELVRHHVGNCWDQTELQREWFNRHGYRINTYLLYYYLRDDCCPSHSILTYEENGAWCWFEPMFCGTAVEYSGVRKYASIVELLEDFKRVFALNGQKMGMLPQDLDESSWSLYEYDKPMYGINDKKFYDYCRSGRKIW